MLENHARLGFRCASCAGSSWSMPRRRIRWVNTGCG